MALSIRMFDRALVHAGRNFWKGCQSGVARKTGMHVPRPVLFFALLYYSLLLDVCHLLFILVGAILFFCVDSLRLELKTLERKSVGGMHPKGLASCGSRTDACNLQGGSFVHRPMERSHRKVDAFPAGTSLSPVSPTIMKAKKFTVEPRKPLQFNASTWEAEVEELLEDIRPKADSFAAIEKLERIVGEQLRRRFPQVEVVGVAYSDLKRGMPFGMVVPDVELVITCSVAVLMRRLQTRGFAKGCSANESSRIAKCAIRAFTDELVRQSGFKFRRSAFRGLDPKVTLLSPALSDAMEEGIPVDIYVNAVTPLFNAVMLMEVGAVDMRAMDLARLVRRWAKDRGVCHAAKGHLPPYVWNILVYFFLQAAFEDAPLLPGLAKLPISASVAMARGPHDGQPTSPIALALAALRPEDVGQKRARWRPPAQSTQTTAELFKGFVEFYGRRFEWRDEAVSLRHARRSTPHARVVHVTGHRVEVGLSIEDPLETTRSLGACMNGGSFQRFKDEIARAVELCEQSASLTQLLQPWDPADEEEQNKQDANDVAA